MILAALEYSCLFFCPTFTSLGFHKSLTIPRLTIFFCGRNTIKILGCFFNCCTNIYKRLVHFPINFPNVSKKCWFLKNPKSKKGPKQLSTACSYVVVAHCHKSSPGARFMTSVIPWLRDDALKYGCFMGW